MESGNGSDRDLVWILGNKYETAKKKQGRDRRLQQEDRGGIQKTLAYAQKGIR